MRTLLFTLVSLASTLSAQDFLLYKFDSPCTNEVINHANGPGAFPANGTLAYNTPTAYQPGMFGGALSGGDAASNTYSRVSSGWSPATQPMTGSITLAFWAKERTPVGTSLNYICGCTSSGHRLFTNGVGGTGLYFRNIVASGPTGLDLALPATTTNFQALASAGWVHIALVVDATAGTADWYVNGTSAIQQTGVGAGLINTAGTYLVGMQLTSNECNYDLDEWLLSNRAYTPVEILGLSLAPRAGDGDYTSATPGQCGGGNVTLGSAGGAPYVGNLGYQLEVAATTPSLFLLLMGLDRCSYGGVIPLPLDGTPLLPLLNGCWILTDAPVLLNGVAVGGPVPVPFPIPPTINVGLDIYTQVLALDIGTSASSMSSGFVTSTGL